MGGLLERKRTAGLARRQTLDVAKLFQGPRFANLLRRPRLGTVHLARRLNLEGGVAYMPRQTDESPAYVQLFRTGAWETAFVAGSRRQLRNGEEHSAIATTLLVDHFRNRALEAFVELKESGFSGPAVVGVALLRADGYGLATNDLFHPMTEPGRSLASPAQLVLSETWVERLEDAEVDDVIGPLLDSLWHAFDLPRCDYFDETTGAWRKNHG